MLQQILLIDLDIIYRNTSMYLGKQKSSGISSRAPFIYLNI